MTPNDFIPTRSSLLKRVRNWEDEQSWQQFFNIYGRLIHSVATKSGLSNAEAQDVVQDTLTVVARKIPGFEYDRTQGSFKSWLLLITRRRIEKQLKKRLPVAVSRRLPDDSRRTSTVERLPDLASLSLEAVWDEEWEKKMTEAALARVKRQVKPRQFQIFDLYAIKQWPVKEVARALDVSITQVYVNKHRIAGLLEKELKKLKRDGR